MDLMTMRCINHHNNLLFVSYIKTIIIFLLLNVAVCAHQNQVWTCSLLGNIVRLLVSCLWYLGFTDTQFSYNIIFIYIVYAY